MINWREKVAAPVAVVAVHQAGRAIDKNRAILPAEWYKQVETYSTHAPVVILGGWSLLQPHRIPRFMDEMVAPAVTISADNLGQRLVDYLVKQGGGTEAAVAEAERIVAHERERARLEARQAAQARSGAGKTSQPIVDGGGKLLA